jgi:hypothetical protein
VAASLVVSNPQPARFLVALLAARRRSGTGFAEAWTDAMRVALAGITSTAERELWMGAFRATMGAWRDAYERDGPPLRLIVLDD